MGGRAHYLTYGAAVLLILEPCNRNSNEKQILTCLARLYALVLVVLSAAAEKVSLSGDVLWVTAAIHARLICTRLGAEESEKIWGVQFPHLSIPQDGDWRFAIGFGRRHECLRDLRGTMAQRMEALLTLWGCERLGIPWTINLTASWEVKLIPTCQNRLLSWEASNATQLPSSFNEFWNKIRAEGSSPVPDLPKVQARNILQDKMNYCQIRLQLNKLGTSQCDLVALFYLRRRRGNIQWHCEAPQGPAQKADPCKGDYEHKILTLGRLLAPLWESGLDEDTALSAINTCPFSDRGKQLLFGKLDSAWRISSVPYMSWFTSFCSACTVLSYWLHTLPEWDVKNVIGLGEAYKGELWPLITCGELDTKRCYGIAMAETIPLWSDISGYKPSQAWPCRGICSLIF